MPAVTGRRIAVLEGGSRFWIFPQIQGASAPLAAALDLCKSYATVGDRFVFLGSQIGVAGQSLDVIEQLAAFQTWAEHEAGNSQGVMWLRGIQEELLERFYTLHMAQDPDQILDWMVLEHGFDALAPQFGFQISDLKRVCAQGASALADFTNQVRQGIRQHSVAAAYFDQCARAAVSDQGNLLFVHGGVDPARTLSLQTDAFWWGHPDFFRLQTPYRNFARVFTTLTPNTHPRLEGPGRLAIDSQCGRGGKLSVLCVDLTGRELFNYSFE